MNITQQLIMLLHELCESYEGLLYHTTFVERVRSMISENRIHCNPGHHISFSRQPSFWYGTFTDVRLVLDGTRISHNYKLDPYVGGSKTTHPDNLVYKKNSVNFEYEVELRGRSLENLHKYLLAIEFSPNITNEDIESTIDVIDNDHRFSHVKIYYHLLSLNPGKHFLPDRDHYSFIKSLQ